MAKKGQHEQREDIADAAINQVLVAEQRAHAAIARAQAEAAELMAQARLRVRRIEDRADARASRLRAACRDWAGKEVAARRDEAERVLACPVESDERYQKLRAAIRRLAADLTGGEP